MTDFLLPRLETQSVKKMLDTELTVEPLQSSPLNGQCGDGYCDESGERNRTSFSCCAEDCGNACLYDECIAPRDLVTEVAATPFSYEQSYTCDFPENYLVNQWRLKIFPPNNAAALTTDWQDSPQILSRYFAIGAYTVLCQ
ncbi:MAG: hypothetical protein H6765_02055 [Candidatus Peribacteria bacterium]|nr:MAG: hypothetical protein H6765_02055 [Candidatus Peribacteria bacterium]